ncbi:MAG: hypothetical protein EBZ77_06425 [Chitinophagia bacterium]|nr:hypothetical protein [Chitinophagia bacterium]
MALGITDFNQVFHGRDIQSRFFVFGDVDEIIRLTALIILMCRIGKALYLAGYIVSKQETVTNKKNPRSIGTCLSGQGKKQGEQ